MDGRRGALRKRRWPRVRPSGPVWSAASVGRRSHRDRGDDARPGSVLRDELFAIDGNLRGVVVGVPLDERDLVVRDLADDLSGRAHDERALGDFLPFGDQGIGTDNAMPAHLDAVEDDAADADQARLADRIMANLSNGLATKSPKTLKKGA